jgi:hypothetical protein
LLMALWRRKPQHRVLALTAGGSGAEYLRPTSNGLASLPAFR